MIASIKGKISQKGEGSLVIQVGGFGVTVFVPELVCLQSEVGQHTNLFTHLVVREDNLSLYGFELKEECELFQHVIRVNGIGPRTGLAIISTLSPDLIYEAVINEKPQIFNQVPGVGNKTSQKIVLFLHDRLKTRIDEGVISGVRNVNNDLLDALIGLGYSIIEAQTAIQSLPKECSEELEERIRLALQYFTS